MNNSELLDLQSEGEKICSALKLLGYNVSKNKQPLRWTIELDVSYSPLARLLGMLVW